MKKADVVLGRMYTAKVSGVGTTVRVLRESPYGGWEAQNLKTGKIVRLRSAQRLGRLVTNEELLGSERIPS
jgi:hypothetical protein